MSSTATIVKLTAEERNDLVAEFKRLGGCGYQRRWKDSTLSVKVERLRMGCPSPGVGDAPEELPMPDQPMDQEPADEPAPPPAPAAEPNLHDPDVVEYLVARGVHRTVREGDRAPMCVGFAMMPPSYETHGDLVVAPDRGVEWLSMVYLPKGFLRMDRMRDVWHLTVRQTAFKFGIPQIGPGGVQSTHALGDDPSVTPDGVTAVGDIPVTSRRLLRAAVSMQWAMLSTGFRCRRKWLEKRDNFVRFVEDRGGAPFAPRRRYWAWLDKFVQQNGREPSVEERIDRSFLFGGDYSSSEACIHTKRWMPVPLLAFPVTARTKLFDSCTLQTLGKGEEVRAMPYGMLNRFLYDVARYGFVPVLCPFNATFWGVERGRDRGVRCCWLNFRTDAGEPRCLRVSPDVRVSVESGAKVYAGQLLGREEPAQLPEGFAQMKTFDQARFLRKELGSPAFDAFVEDWFARYCFEIRSGFVHVPAVLSQYAATQSVPGRLMWDVTHCLAGPSLETSCATDEFDFWSSDFEGFLFPTLNEKAIASWVDERSGVRRGSHSYVVRDDLHETVMDLTVQEPGFQEVPCSYWQWSAGRVGRLQKAIEKENEDLEADLAQMRRVADEERAELAKIEHDERQAALERARQWARLRGAVPPAEDDVFVPGNTSDALPTKEQLSAELEKLTSSVEEQTFEERMTRLWGDRWTKRKQ